MPQSPTPKAVVDAIERLLGPQRLVVQFASMRAAHGAFVATIDSTEWVIPADSASENLELAVRDTFMCSKCDGRLEANPLFRYVVHGRAACSACAGKQWVSGTTGSSILEHTPGAKLMREMGTEVRQDEPFRFDSLSGFGGPMCTECNGSQQVAVEGYETVKQLCRCTKENPPVFPGGPAFDTDIRIGDVVEVVSIDEEAMRKRGCSRAFLAKLSPGEHILVGATSVLDTGTVLVNEQSGQCRYRYGRFRVLERDGKAYVRETARSTQPKRKTVALFGSRADVEAQLKVASDDVVFVWVRDVGCMRGHRFTSAVNLSIDPVPAELEVALSVHWDFGVGPPQIVSIPALEAEEERKRDTISAPAPETDETLCAWCNKPCSDSGDTLGATTHKDCARYWLGLQERLKVGDVNDCAEERDSVRCFVDQSPDHDSIIFPGDLVECVAWTKHVPFDHHVYVGVGYRGVAQIVGRSSNGDGTDIAVFFNGCTKASKTDGKCGDCTLLEERRVYPETEGFVRERERAKSMDPVEGWAAGSNPNGAEWP
jgi:hypothetical protein